MRSPTSNHLFLLGITLPLVCGQGCSPAESSHSAVLAVSNVALEGEIFDEAIERLKTNGCRLFAYTGRCGHWLVIVDGGGYTVTTTYYDSDTKLPVGYRYMDDTGADYSTLGQIECSELTDIEDIPCLF